MGSYFLTSGRPYAVATPAAPVPVVGAELLANGDMEIGDPPTGYTASGTSVLTRSIDAYAGTYAFGIERGSGNIAATITATATNGAWLRLSAFAKLVSGVSAGITGDELAIKPIATHSLSGYAPVAFTDRAAVTTIYLYLLVTNTAGSQALFDNASIVPLTLSSLVSTSLYTSADIDLSAAVTLTTGTQAGFAARVDDPANPANFLLAYLDGAGNVKLDKCVGGTYTNLVSGAVTYGASKLLRLLCIGTSVSVYYDGTQVGTTQTVSDAGIVGNVNHGLFSTYASNSFASYTASSWVAVTP